MTFPAHLLLAAPLISPALLGAGALLMAAPILIHLLNRRRFRRVEWAAIEFLQEANRRNRRRIRLEEFLLLLLRCLAVLLIGLLLARPFLSSNPLAALLKGGQYERIVVLDDSLSMNASPSGASPMVAARKRLNGWINRLVADGANDSLTLYLTSMPDKPVYNGAPLNEEALAGILDRIEKLGAVDARSDLAAALARVEKALTSESRRLNRAVYVLTDLRAHDWKAAGESGDAAPGSSAIETLKRIAGTASGVYVVDLGDGENENLVLEALAPLDKTLIAGVPARFEASVRNRSDRAAGGVRVRFHGGDSPPVEKELGAIPAGGAGTATFTHTFARDPGAGEKPEPRRVRVEIVAGSGDARDALRDDNVRYLPARLTSGIPVLVVDGDPSGAFGQSETLYVEKALSPRGDAVSGVDVTVVDEDGFADADLSDYQVVFLCNLYRVAAEVRGRLESWVRAGGGVVLALGDQVDEDFYNNELHKAGAGLLPLALESIEGDESEENCAFLNPVARSHAIFRYFEGESSPLLAGVNVFRWWKGKVPAELLDKGTATMVARFTGDGEDPAIVESRFGDGRVLTLTTPLDDDWSNWPKEAASYLIALQEMTRHIAGSRAEEGTIRAGQPIEAPVSLTRFKTEASVAGPDEKTWQVEARPPAEGESAVWRIDFENTRRKGFYELELAGTGGGPVASILFAANVDEREGDLRRIERASLKSSFGDAPVVVLGNAPFEDMARPAGRSELWKVVLAALAVVLIGEAAYARWLGAKR